MIHVHASSHMLHVWNNYLATFALEITQMWVNIPYMGHMGLAFIKFLGNVPRGEPSCP